jgi:hypothetical protein
MKARVGDGMARLKKKRRSEVAQAGARGASSVKYDRGQQATCLSIRLLLLNQESIRAKNAQPC